jgi:hypothetical protein
MYTFYHDFGQELSQVDKLNAYYTGFCKARGQPVPPLPTSLQIDGRELFGIMMKPSTRIDKIVAKAIGRLRESGKFKLAALTNNFAPPTVHKESGKEGEKVPSLEEELNHLGLGQGTKKVRSMFDHYVESAVVGMRKPEEGFYRHALDLLNVKAHEVVFLDDIGMCVLEQRRFLVLPRSSSLPIPHSNLKAAQALGIRTIRE